MKRTAYAKINLDLNVTGRRDDGYHLLHSSMVFTEWGDEIILTSSNQFRLTADGPYSNIFTTELLSVGKGSPNLIVKAVYLMAEKAQRNPDIHVHVTKNIPVGAGLGGGSADAAAVMHMLNDYWEMRLSLAELAEMGLRIGAELPVCLRAPAPCLVQGIGEKISPLDTVPTLYLLIAWPDHGLLTKDVFDAYRAAELPFTQPGTDCMTGNNDLTSAAIGLCPSVGEILSDLAESEGCSVARMSGSGAACYGVFDTKEAAEAASARFKNAVVTTTRTQV